MSKPSSERIVTAAKDQTTARSALRMIRLRWISACRVRWGYLVRRQHANFGLLANLLTRMDPA